jgi:hypothetical protein
VVPAPPGARQHQAAQEKAYRRALAGIAAWIREVGSTLDFKSTKRGWCYIAENQGLITKGQFDKFDGWIDECRWRGLVPVDITADDAKRSADNLIDRRRRPEAGRALCRKAIEKYLDLGQVAAFEADREADRREVRARLPGTLRKELEESSAPPI